MHAHLTFFNTTQVNYFKKTTGKKIARQSRKECIERNVHVMRSAIHYNIYVNIGIHLHNIFTYRREPSIPRGRLMTDFRRKCNLLSNRHATMIHSVGKNGRRGFSLERRAAGERKKEGQSALRAARRKSDRAKRAVNTSRSIGRQTELSQ